MPEEGDFKWERARRVSDPVKPLGRQAHSTDLPGSKTPNGKALRKSEVRA